MQLRLDKSDAVEFARQRASVLDVSFKVTARASADIADDLTKIANSRVQDLVILGWNRQKSDRINEGGRRVHHLMQHIRAPVGTLFVLRSSFFVLLFALPLPLKVKNANNAGGSLQCNRYFRRQG